MCDGTNTHTHAHTRAGSAFFKLKKDQKPEINYPSKGNVVENIIYGTIMKMARLSENLTII